MKMEEVEGKIKEELRQYLLSMNELDERLPECPDVEEKWESIANAYLPDGIREFQSYPFASLAWMMYIGMAVAKMWDEDWEIYSKIADIYAFLRDKRGYDCMDEYIMEDMLMLQDDGRAALEKITGECASRLCHHLYKSFEPGTKEAFDGYVACLRQLYAMGAYMQLKRMGYRMRQL